MSNEQILKKSIEKAVKNGWNEGSLIDWSLNWEQIANSDERIYHSFLFSHDFAKAFWGEEIDNFPIRNTDNQEEVLGTYTTERWKGHIVKMVLEEEPIKYIEKFL